MHGCELMGAKAARTGIERAVRLVLSGVCLFFLALTDGRAQVTTADIVGTVTDPSGAAVVTGTATATNTCNPVYRKR